MNLLKFCKRENLRLYLQMKRNGILTARMETEAMMARMVWGAFCSDGCLEIQFVSCKMNSTDNVKMSLLPFIAHNPVKIVFFLAR